MVSELTQINREQAITVMIYENYIKEIARMKEIISKEAE